jgi:hypothetical protein
MGPVKVNHLADKMAEKTGKVVRENVDERQNHGWKWLNCP